VYGPLRTRIAASAEPNRSCGTPKSIPPKTSSQRAEDDCHKGYGQQTQSFAIRS
jgi:hypothetical protein